MPAAKDSSTAGKICAAGAAVNQLLLAEAETKKDRKVKQGRVQTTGMLFALVLFRGSLCWIREEER